MLLCSFHQDRIGQADFRSFAVWHSVHLLTVQTGRLRIPTPIPNVYVHVTKATGVRFVAASLGSEGSTVAFVGAQPIGSMVLSSFRLNSLERAVVHTGMNAGFVGVGTPRIPGRRDHPSGIRIAGRCNSRCNRKAAVDRGQETISEDRHSENTIISRSLSIILQWQYCSFPGCLRCLLNRPSLSLLKDLQQ